MQSTFKDAIFCFARLCAAILILGLSFSRTVNGDGIENILFLESADRTQLASAVGVADSGVLRRIANHLGTRKLIAAFYRGTRAERLTALDAAMYVETPSDIMPALVALMGAADRQTAARAAATVTAILNDPIAEQDRWVEMIPLQAAQLIAQLVPIARDGRLDVDVRIAAVTGIDRLAKSAHQSDFQWSIPLFDDAEVAVRRAAVGVQRVPLENNILMKLAKSVGEDPDPAVRGLLANMLCENALSHGVKEPSPDLSEVLKSAVKDPAISTDMLKGTLVCLRRFAPEGRRRSIVEAALSNTNKDVTSLVKTLQLKQ